MNSCQTYLLLLTTLHVVIITCNAPLLYNTCHISVSLRIKNDKAQDHVRMTSCISNPLTLRALFFSPPLKYLF